MNALPAKPDPEDTSMGTGLHDLTPFEVAFVKKYRSERVAVVAAETLARLFDALGVPGRGYFCRKDARTHNRRVTCVDRSHLGTMLQRAAKLRSC